MLQNLMNFDFLIALINAGIRMATPIVLAATGEVFMERAGIRNIGLEGQMLLGAFFAFTATFYTKNLFIGLLSGMICGMLSALILAISSITFNSNQTLVGIALNMFSAGSTSFLYWLLFGVAIAPPLISKIPIAPIPVLSSIPIIGKVFFQHSVVVYLCYALTITSFVTLFRTTYGLKLRACGEYPKAAETMGVNVAKMRYQACLIGGAFAGLGGAFLSLVVLGMFCDNVTAGRGFVALAIVIFGRWNPVLCFLGAVFFGIIDAFQLRVQALGFRLPYQLLLMLPYVLTLVVMRFTGKNVNGPAATGKPYVREGM